MTQTTDQTQVESDPDPFEEVANEHNMTIDRQANWVYIRDIRSNYPLTVYRPHKFKMMDCKALELDIENALKEYEPKPVDMANFWAEAEQRKRRRSIVTGQFK